MNDHSSWSEVMPIEFYDVAPIKLGILKLGVFNGDDFEQKHMMCVDEPHTIRSILSECFNDSGGKNERLINLLRTEDKKSIYFSFLETDMPHDTMENIKSHNYMGKFKVRWTTYEKIKENDPMENLKVTYTKKTYGWRASLELLCCCLCIFCFGMKRNWSGKIAICDCCELPIKDYHIIVDGKYVCPDDPM